MSERNKIIFIKIAIPIVILAGAALINRIMSISIDNLVISPAKCSTFDRTLNVFWNFTTVQLSIHPKIIMCNWF